MSTLPHTRILREYTRVGFGPHGLAGSLRGCVGAIDRWISWAEAKQSHGPLLWFHGASVGELRSLEPILHRIRSSASAPQFIFTHTSPSVEQWYPMFEVDRVDYMPVGPPAALSSVFNAVKPGVLVFSRGDVWPHLVSKATERGIPLMVVGAEVRSDSKRLTWPLRSIFRRSYRSLDYVGAVTEEDALLYARLGARTSAIDVIGDPRHDQVLERTAVVRSDLFNGCQETTRRVVVAGSIEADDEDPLLDCMASYEPATRPLLIAAPHEPSRSNVSRLLQSARDRGLTAESLTGNDPEGDHECLVVDKLGLLGDLYAIADVAYVGGGFRKNKLHSVIEPAAFGVPVVLGPYWRNIADADPLVKAGGAVALGAEHPLIDLQSELDQLLNDADYRWKRGLRARRCISRGAADAAAAAIMSRVA
ncbi:MAG: hypothetical protein O7D29_10100 [Gemmatimonadetes bacterium]|nr:hypothetical protein [Gemmatimonadota bacterium]